MHLGLIDRPFVPHNLISTQESPVPPLKFKMAPRLKILIASGSKKQPRYTLLVPQKSRQTNPSRFPNRAPMEREALLQGILRISQKPHLSGSPVKEPSLQVPLCLPRFFPAFIPIMQYLSAISISRLSYVILYIICPSRLGSSLKSFVEFTDCGDNEILFHLVLSSILLALPFLY